MIAHPRHPVTRPAGWRPVRDPFALRYLTHPVGGRRPHRRWMVRVPLTPTT